MKKNVEKSVESRTSANSVRWGGDREFDYDDDAANSTSWGGDRMMMKKSANSASWAGDREFVDDDDIGEQCELGWR